jgi:hypothetical protein
MEISAAETKLMAFRRKYPDRTNIAIGNHVLEQVRNFNHLDCDVSHDQDEDIVNKFHRLQRIYGTIKRQLKNTRRET